MKCLGTESMSLNRAISTLDVWVSHRFPPSRSLCLCPHPNSSQPQRICIAFMFPLKPQISKDLAWPLSQKNRMDKAERAVVDIFMPSCFAASSACTFPKTVCLCLLRNDHTPALWSQSTCRWSVLSLHTLTFQE